MADERSGITDSNHPDWEKYKAEGHGRTDEQIRADVHEVLQKAAPSQSSLELEVADAIVTLKGDHADRDKLVERIRAVPSVKDVRTQS